MWKLKPVSFDRCSQKHSSKVYCSFVWLQKMVLHLLHPNLLSTKIANRFHLRKWYYRTYNELTQKQRNILPQKPLSFLFLFFLQKMLCTNILLSFHSLLNFKAAGSFRTSIESMCYSLEWAIKHRRHCTPRERLRKTVGWWQGPQMLIGILCCLCCTGRGWVKWWRLVCHMQLTSLSNIRCTWPLFEYNIGCFYKKK